MAMGTAFGQEPVSDPNAEGFDLVKYVDDYIEEHWVAPAPRGEFETTSAWKERVSEEKREQKQNLIHKALYKLYGKPRFTLGEFDADNRYFLIETKRFGSYIAYMSEYRGGFTIKTDRSGKAYTVWMKSPSKFKEELKAGIIPFRYKYGLEEGKPRLVSFYEYDWEYHMDLICPFDKNNSTPYRFFWRDNTWVSGKDMYKYSVYNGYDGYTIDWKPFSIDEVDEKPSFPGDMTEWLRNNLNNEVYSLLKREEEWNEKIISLYVTIGADGTIYDVSGGHYGKYEKLCRVVENMPKWYPGKKRNRPVVVGQRIEIDLNALSLTPPSFPGDEEKWLKDNLIYPKNGKGKSDTIYVKVIVYSDGSIKILSSVKDFDKESKPFAKEAIRLVKAMPKVNPARKWGEPIDVRMNIPIPFEP